MNEEVTQPTSNSTVSLREVTKDNLGAILKLKVKPEQEQFVASNAVSISQAHFEEKAWFRAIYADETPVGFLMLYDDSEASEYFLWRFMIDAGFQRLQFGKKAVQHLIDYVRTRPGATELLVSYVPAPGCPEPFYASLGFVETGEVNEGENVMRLIL